MAAQDENIDPVSDTQPLAATPTKDEESELLPQSSEGVVREETPPVGVDGTTTEDKDETDQVDAKEDGVSEVKHKADDVGPQKLELDDVEEEVELPPPEMTPEEKQAMVDCVRRGDIEEFEELLDKPGADLNMVWYCENLLMTAVRWKREEMATYLIDNGVDVLFETTRLQVYEDPNEPKKKNIGWYTVTCRQVAYDNGLQDVVDLIDLESGEALFHTPEERTPRLWKPKQIRELERLQVPARELSDLSSVDSRSEMSEDDARSHERGEDADSESKFPDDALDGSDVVRNVGNRRQSLTDRNEALEGNEGGLVADDNQNGKIPSARFGNIPRVIVEADGESVKGSVTKEIPGQDVVDGDDDFENDGALPCHSRGACTDDGVYGKYSPLATTPVQNRVKSAGPYRIGGTRTDVYRKRDSKRKLLLRDQNQNRSDFTVIKPVLANGSYPVESKRWSSGDTQKKMSSAQRCDSPILSRKSRPPHSTHSSAQTSDVFIKPKGKCLTSSQGGGWLGKNDKLDSFPSIGSKTTRLSHQQTFLKNVGGRRAWEKK